MKVKESQMTRDKRKGICATGTVFRGGGFDACTFFAAVKGRH
jgi:hypothetical protein